MHLPIENHLLINDIKFVKPLKSLSFKHYSEVQRDGNCFYSAISLLLHPLIQNNVVFRELFLSFNNKFEVAGFSSAVYETYTEYYKETLIQKNIEDFLNDDFKISVGYLRIITATHIILNKEQYINFIEADFDSYSHNEILSMGSKAGHVEINALAESLSLKIIIHDITSGEERINEIGSGFEIHILHTPDHFEPIYK